MYPTISAPRAAIRMSIDCHVRVRDRANSGHPLRVDATVVRFWSTGLYMYVRTPLSVGDRVFMVVPLPAGARVALRGHVIRVELQHNARFGLTVRFTRTRLMSAVDATG
jgi:hypothetical protein